MNPESLLDDKVPLPGDDSNKEETECTMLPAVDVGVGDDLKGNDGISTLSLLHGVLREELIREQGLDDTPKSLFALVDQETACGSYYFLQDGLLCRKWVCERDSSISHFIQVIVPLKFREKLLELAHGGLSGHMGVSRTYNRVLPSFFWPRVKRDVALFVRKCHVCQLTGKPNQTLPVVPLQPIPALSEPFEHLLVDCVGPLPPSKSGHCYLLTVICPSTRYPAAFPLRSINTKSVLKALTTFMSTFGIPKIIQSDQGSNFMSGQFSRDYVNLERSIVSLVPIIPKARGH